MNEPAIQFAAISTRTPRSSLCSPDRIPALCRDAGHAACVLADPGFLNAMHPFSRACAASGIHPVFGLLAPLAPDPPRTPRWPLPPDPAAMLLARGPAGLSLLMEHSWSLLSGLGRATAHGRTHRPVLKPGLIQPHPELAILPLGPEAIRILGNRATAALVPDLSAEPLASPAARAALDAAHRAGLPAIPYLPILSPAPTTANRDSLAILWADHADATFEGASDALPDLAHPLSAGELRQRYAAHPQLLRNASILAASCNAMPVPMEQPPPDRAEALHLAELSREALRDRFSPDPPPSEYRDRLETELQAIAGAGWSGIFIAVKTFLDTLRERDILIGPGRGSAAGSLVSWCLGITVPDPIEHGLVFERFINPERVSPPDFDIDFPSRAQALAQETLRTLWGHDRTAAVSGVATYALRQAYTSAAKRRGVSHQRVQRSLAAAKARGIPANPSDPILQLAAADAVHLAASNAAFAVTRHPAAIALAPEAWRGRIPAYPAEKGDTLQTDHVESEDAGLVKIDCLALSTLDALEIARSASGGPHPWRLPQDADVYDALASGQTHGVFQLDGPGITLAVQQIRPTCFNDLRAIIALYRPGAMEHLDVYAARAKELEAPEPPHPLLEEALRETHGLIIYQEQAMAAAMALARFSPSEADALRRAIGKKKAHEMQALQERFLQGCRQNGVDPSDARLVWSQLEAHAGYSFNRAHATAYAMISYATAFYALHYPAHWLAALADTAMLDPRPEPRLRRIASHAALHRLPLLPPDPLRARSRFHIDRNAAGNPVIRAPVHAIPGWGLTLASAFHAALEAQTGRRRPKAERIAEILLAIPASPAQKSALIAACAPNPDAALRLQVAVDRSRDPPPPSWPFAAEPFPHPDPWKAMLVRANALPIRDILQRVHIPDPSLYPLRKAYRAVAIVTQRSQGKSDSGPQIDIADPTGSLRLRTAHRDTGIPETLQPGTLCFGNLAVSGNRISLLDLFPLAEYVRHWPSVLVLRGDAEPIDIWETAASLIGTRCPGLARVEYHLRLDFDDSDSPFSACAVLHHGQSCSVDDALLQSLRQLAPGIELRFYAAPSAAA